MAQPVYSANDQVSIDDLLRRVHGYLPQKDVDGLRKAYDFALKVHGQQKAAAGKSYICHALTVAHTLAAMQLDLETLQAGMLHGIFRDPNTPVSEKEVKAQFGPTVESIVSGVTKINKVEFNTSLDYQAENIRKMLLAMSSDIRVLLVKLACRLHFMQVLDMPEAEKKDYATETMDLYAPLASRLGVDWLKRELEDLSFACLYPKEYQDLAARVDSSTMDRASYVEEVKELLSNKLREQGLTDFLILGRPKHLYSIYRKILAQNIPVEKVYDKVAFRIILPTVRECYEALGLVHSLWVPIDGRFKDFISSPKSNMYQSLHTSVIGPHGNFMEIQIRTEEMDKIAKEGIAAHWAYKEGTAISQKDAKLFQWLKQLIQWLQELKDPKEFLDAFKGELHHAETYVLTPNGEVKELPEESTPLDFAYSIHTQVGNRCTGAKINGRLVPLKTILKNGDVVEILTSPHQQPSRGWLSLVKTSRAKSRIRQWLRQEEMEKSLKLGQEICERELRKHNLSLKKLIKTGHLKEILKRANSNVLEDLLRKVGSGKIRSEQLVELLLPAEVRKEKEEAEAPAYEIQVEAASSPPPAKSGSGDVIEIDGIDGLLVKISHCCLPMPGDEIMGFITAGRGISVHKTYCPNLRATDPLRRIEVQWSSTVKTQHRAHIQIVAQDQKGLLVTICNAITNDDANIVNVEAHASKDNMARLNIILEVNNIDHLSTLLQHLRQLDQVIEAKRR
ncbi:MAG: bifunctional (p)ppGpp synthetase/guanosine-3',5'-bis(diphosphate) 3'-pyrophosphohydrolase [Deltaproteobacteria bacterium]|nr:bifunctional (p)ppGpp synthetase/guanosine-3',5'-bis(diphosphate) 3'-pyrophosphohydrolase [Deltaproteobacteria bacterium]